MNYEKKEFNLNSIKDKFNLLKRELHKTIIGQDNLIEKLIISIISGGHCIIEGVPGLAKSLTISSLASAVSAKFNRIQFTPDILPADLTGTMIYNHALANFSVKKGPLFADIILADEINRAPAKVQSALLESMQEKQISIGEETFSLSPVFTVFATQNPIEQEGTYPLSEAQSDRFMFKVSLNYPSKQEEIQILNLQTENNNININPILSIEDIIGARYFVKSVYIDEKIKNYVVELIDSTRNPENYKSGKLKEYIEWGASPRASIYLTLGAKALALLSNRDYVIPEDVRKLAHEILRHRIGLSFEADAENISSDNIIDELLKNVKSP